MIERPISAGSRPASPETNGGLRAWRILLVTLGVVYLIQVRTPLRLEVDSWVMMSEAESVVQGTGFLDDGVKTPLPPGYPAVLAVLLKLGLAHAWVLMVFNLAWLALGLAALRLLLQGSLEQPGDVTLGIMCAFLLSWVVIKHTAMPLTEISFFGLTMSCLVSLAYAERRALGKRFYLAVSGAGLLFLASLSMRMVGVALLPAFLWVGFSRKELRRILRAQSPRAKAAAAVVAIVILSPIAVFHVWSYTAEVYRVVARRSSISEMAFAAVMNHGTEIGELAVNVPQRILPAGLRTIPLFCIGIAVAFVTLGGLLRRRDRFSSTEVFFISYVGIICVWPYSDPRFWLPVLPLVMVYARMGLSVWLRSERWTPFLRAYKLAFALTGVAALIYSTRLSFSGSDFPLRFTTTNGPLRATYCAAQNGCREPYDVREVDPKILHVLQTFR